MSIEVTNIAINVYDFVSVESSNAMSVYIDKSTTVSDTPGRRPVKRRLIHEFTSGVMESPIFEIDNPAIKYGKPTSNVVTQPKGIMLNNYLLLKTLYCLYMQVFSYLIQFCNNMMKFIMIKLNCINYNVIICLCICRKEFKSKEKQWKQYVHY